MVVYESTGNCKPDTGECEYDFTERHCEHGCYSGRCLDEDLCRNVVCDDPPAGSCKDESTLLEYEAPGTCDPDTGRCNYESADLHCEHGCAGGRCLAEDKCRGIVCDHPPVNTCEGDDTLRQYEAVGDCNPDTGDCNYDFNDRHCEHGCESGRCLNEDPCQNVVCDDPPAGSCMNVSTLLEYEAPGTCDPDTGRCNYESAEVHCEHGCVGGRCLAEDKCRGVVCDRPPENTCKDESTLLMHESIGDCNPDTGECEYDVNEHTCEHGCRDGRCLTGKTAWGWINVLEINRAYMNTDWAWMWFGVGAYFSVQTGWPACLRSPEHRMLDNCCSELASQGACRMFGHDLTDDIPCEGCGPDEVCAPDPVNGEWACRSYPSHWNVGTITIEGLKTDVELTRDECDRYVDYDLPWDADLFDGGDPIDVHVSGGDLGPFSLSANGVTHLEIASSIVDLERGHSATVLWTPADPGTRIQVILSVGGHWPNLPSAVMICDANDSDGQVEIPADLVDVFLDRAGQINRYSHIIRYTQNVQSPFEGEIELRVGSVRNLQLVLE